MRGHAHLGDDVRRMRRAADTVSAQVGFANFGMHSKDQLDRVGEIELEIEVAGLAVSVLGDLAKRVGHLARDAANRAKQVPVQLEQTLAGTVQTGRDDLIGIEPESLGQSQRPDAGDLLGRSDDQVLGQPVDDRGIDPALDQAVDQAIQPLAPRAGIRAASSNGSTAGRNACDWRWPLQRRIDAAIDFFEALAHADAHPPARSEANRPGARLELAVSGSSVVPPPGLGKSSTELTSHLNGPCVYSRRIPIRLGSTHS